MDEKLLEKIFKYNIYWLSDEKRFGDVVIQKVEGYAERLANKIFSAEQLRDYRYQKNVPDYVKGSLIDNANSMALKENLRSKIFQSDITEQFLKLSNYCIVNDFMRYKECDAHRLSRPLITFIAPKDTADKLKYLNNQELAYEYVSLDYKTLQYVTEEKRRDKPDIYRYNTMSEKFNNYVKKSVEDGDDEYFFYIATELGHVKLTDKQRIRSMDDFGKRKAEFASESTNYNLQLQEIRDKKKEISKLKDDKNKSNQEKEKQKEKLEKEIENLKKITGNFTKGTESLRETLSQLTVKDEYRLLTDFEYRKILERFKTRAEAKLKVKIDLEEWSFCIVFSPLWCDSEHIPDRRDGLSLLQYLVNNPDDIISSFNDKQNKSSIDFSLLYYLTTSFQQPKVSQIDSYYKLGELENFKVILYAFRKFENGGYWIKKIVKGGGKFKEKTEGPYSMKDAEIRVAILKNIMTLKDLEIAKIFTFKELVCDNNLLDLESDGAIDKYVSVKNRYSPPKGASLFCLIKGYVEVIYFNRKELTKKFRKFSDHAINAGMSYFGTLEYLIYYNPDSKSSVRKAGELKKLFMDKDRYTSDNFLWLVDSVLGKEEKRGKEPDILPFNILSEFQKRGKLEYEGLEKLYQLIENYECPDNRLEISFDNFTEAIGDDYISTYRNKDFDIKKELNLGVLENNLDDKQKKFKIIKNYDNTWEVGMHRFRQKLKDIKLISVKDIKDCKGYLEVKFKDKKDKSWDIDKLNLISNDQFFNNETVLICLTLFVSKAFGVKTVVLDNRLKSIECEKNIMIHHYHIYYLGIGNFETFEEIGFVIENYAEYRELLDNIKNMKIIDFVIQNKMEIKIDKKVENFTLEKFCKEYLDSERCYTKNNLVILKQLSNYIDSVVKLKVFIDLDEISFNHLKQFIKSSKY